MPLPNTNEDKMPQVIYLNHDDMMEIRANVYSIDRSDTTYIRKDSYDAMEKCLRDLMSNVEPFVRDLDKVIQTTKAEKALHKSFQSTIAILNQE